MNIRALEAFRAIMRTGSMTGAARLIHTTQPNISRLISGLEAELGLRLFAREGNRLHVTDEGFAFYKEVEQHYAGLAALRDAARTIRQFGTGRLHVAVAPVLSHGFLASVVVEFAKRYPLVTLSIRTCNSHMVEELVDAQLCDLGLSAFIGSVIGPGVETELVADVRGVCLMRGDHPLAAQACVRARDLEGVPFISIARQNGSREHVDKVFQDAGVSRKIEMEAETAATICHLVAQGLGVSLLTSIIARDYAGLGVVARDFEPAVHFPITVLRSSQRPRGLLAGAFVECVQAVLASHAGDAGGQGRDGCAGS